MNQKNVSRNLHSNRIEWDYYMNKYAKCKLHEEAGIRQMLENINAEHRVLISLRKREKKDAK